MLLDPGSGCASPLSIDGVAFGVVAWSTSRILTVQVGQTVLDRYSVWVERIPPGRRSIVELVELMEDLTEVLSICGTGSHDLEDHVYCRTVQA